MSAWTPEDLARLASIGERLGKRTAGEWRAFRNHHAPGPLKGAFIDADVNGRSIARVADVLSHGGVGSQTACDANADFIAHAPDDIKWLLARCSPPPAAPAPAAGDAAAVVEKILAIVEAWECGCCPECEKSACEHLLNTIRVSALGEGTA